MTLTASARSDGAAVRQTVEVNGRHTIITDEPSSLGGSDTGPAPHELLPATLASCIATMIALYAQRREWDIGEQRVDVAYDTACPRGRWLRRRSIGRPSPSIAPSSSAARTPVATIAPVGQPPLELASVPWPIMPGPIPV